MTMSIEIFYRCLPDYLKNCNCKAGSKTDCGVFIKVSSWRPPKRT